MYGDPFKFYRHVHIPLMDAIHGYPYGRPGFKLISSAADAFDKQLVGAEIYGNYSDRETDSAMLYRVAMEVMARGVNFLVPHGMWYEPDTVKIPPLIAHYNPRLAPALPGYNDFAGRSTFLLQGGRRVADIALLFPIQSLEAWYAWETGRPRCGKDVPPGTDYNRIGDLLTGQIRRDFTFLHPEDFVTDKYQIGNGQTLRRNSQQSLFETLPVGQMKCELETSAGATDVKRLFRHLFRRNHHMIGGHSLRSMTGHHPAVPDSVKRLRQTDRSRYPPLRIQQPVFVRDCRGDRQRTVADPEFRCFQIHRKADQIAFGNRKFR